jgi:hypothetical protein
VNDPVPQQPGPAELSIATRPVKAAVAGPSRQPANPTAPIGSPGAQGVQGRAALPPPANQGGRTYRFVVADDWLAWSGATGRGGLLQLDEGDQLDAFDQLTADGNALVVICGTRQVAAVRRASALARSRSRARVAVSPVPLGPLGQSVLTMMVQQLVASAGARPVAELIVRLPTFAAAVLDLALVSSVAKLDLPFVTVRHHLMSHLPGRRTFVVQIAPDTALARISSTAQLRPSSARLHLPAFDDSYGALVTIAGPRPVPGALLPFLRTTVLPPALPTAPQLSAYWTDPEATEVVVTPADVTRWALAVLPDLETWPCGWCDEPLAAPVDRCVFCGNSVR